MLTRPQQFYTFSTVPTEFPPMMDENAAAVMIDASKTFFDVPENGGKYQEELPVPGSVKTIDAMADQLKVANASEIPLIATVDTHIRGKNPTLASTFIGIPANTFLSPDLVATWTESNNPIRPESGIDLQEFKDWNASQGGTMAWADHGTPDSPLYNIHPVLFALFVLNPNGQLFKKGSQRSKLYRTLFPESYSADEMSTGESLGLYEFLVARGVKRVFLFGLAGDFCVGSTALNLARKGLEVWVCVDAQACVNLPDYQGSGMTSEEMMVKKLMDAGVHFYTNADSIKANKSFFM